MKQSHENQAHRLKNWIAVAIHRQQTTPDTSEVATLRRQVEALARRRSLLAIKAKARNEMEAQETELESEAKAISRSRAKTEEEGPRRSESEKQGQGEHIFLSRSKAPPQEGQDSAQSLLPCPTP